MRGEAGVDGEGEKGRGTYVTVEKVPEPVPLKFTKENELFPVGVNWFSRVTWIDINKSDKRSEEDRCGTEGDKNKRGERERGRGQERERGREVPRDCQHIERFPRNRACHNW